MTKRVASITLENLILNRKILIESIRYFTNLDAQVSESFFNTFTSYDNAGISILFADLFFKENKSVKKELEKLEEKADEFFDYVLSLGNEAWKKSSFEMPKQERIREYFQLSVQIKSSLMDYETFEMYIAYMMQSYQSYNLNTNGTFKLESIIEIIRHAKTLSNSEKDFDTFKTRLKLFTEYYLLEGVPENEKNAAKKTVSLPLMMSSMFLQNLSELNRLAILEDLKKWQNDGIYKNIGKHVTDNRFVEYFVKDKIKTWNYHGEIQFMFQTVESISNPLTAAAIINNLDSFIIDENNERLYEICLNYEFAGIIISNYFSKQLHSSSNKREAMLKIGEYKVSERKKLQKAVSKMNSMKDSALDWVTEKQAFDESDIDRIIDYEEKTTVTSAPIILGSATPGKKELPKSYRSIISRIEREGDEFTHVALEFQRAYENTLQNYESRINEMWKEFGNDPSVAAFYHIAMNINAISAEKFGNAVIRQIMNNDLYFEGFISNFSTRSPYLAAIAKKESKAKNESKNYKAEIEAILFPANS